MKQKLLRATLLLSSILLCLYSSYAQTHYTKANSVPGVEVREGGGVNSICPVTVSHFSAANSTDQFFFSPLTCLADYLKFEIFNPTTGAVKVTLTTTYGAAVNQWVLAPNNSTGVMVIPWSMTYNWKFETSTLPFSMKADTIQLDTGLGATILPGTNDIAVPSGTGFRVKSGQTITLGTLVPSSAGSAELFFTSNNTTGSQNIVLEAYNTTSNAVLGESTLRLIVNTRCNFGITSAVQESLGSQFYNVTMTSNRTTKPYYYEIINSLSNIVKRGNTSAANLSSVESIDVGNIASGIYTIKMYSTALQGCGEPTKQFSHVNATDVCTLNASASKVGSSYTITLPIITGISAYDYVFKTSTDSVISQGTTNSNTLSLSFANKVDGEYFVFLKPNNSVKVCSQNLKLIWATTQSNNSRGYLKRYNNAADYFEIAGAGDYTGTKDAGTGWIVKENKTSLIWKTYIKSLSNVSGAKAILTLREDSSSTSRHISIAIENDRIKVIQRLNKNGNNIVTTEVTGKTAPRWAQIRRVGNNAILEESTSAPESDTQTFTTLATINDVFSTWKPIYYKGLYVNSGSSTSLASAEFHRFLGGAYTGTTQAVDNTPLSAPVIASSNLNPTANASLTFSASVCKSGFLIQYYKNGLPIYQGANYTVTVTYGDSYKAKCEKGSEKSAFSNTIAFNAPANDQICNISDGLLLGQKTAYGSTYNMYARIFSGKLWLTQNLGTTPESFLVRGINLLNANFVKAWSGSDYSCFEGQNTEFGGNVEPAGFTTPSGYTKVIQPDGAKIYTLGTGSGVSPPTLVSSPEIPSTSTSVTFTVNNCAGTVTFFKNGTNYGTTTPLIVAIPTANDVYTAKCTVGSSTSASSNSISIIAPVVSGGGNTALAIAPAEIVIPEETEWNRFRPEIIPSVTLPTKLDPITGLVLPDKWFIWHSPFRNMFGYVANQNVTDPVTRLNNELAGMRRLGFMAQLWNFTEPCYETTQTFPNGSNCTFTTTQTTLDVTKEVISGENPLGVLGEDPMTFANRTYDDFIGGINYSRKPFINGKYQSLAYITDGENIYTGGNEQKDANALVNAYYKVSSDIRGYIGNQYLAPNNSLGIMSDDFFAGNTSMLSWHANANAGTHSGKSLQNLNQILSIAEMGTLYEDMLPEGTVVKDQNGNNWFTISHFGTNVGVDIDYTKPGGANARHWAVQYGGITFKNAKDAHATGHKHLMSFKPGNQIGNGYMYSPESASWHDGKHIKDFDLSMGPEYYNNPSVTQTPNDTPLPPWMMEGAVLLTMFEGADGIYLWNSAWNKKLYPITKTGNARNHEHQIDPTLDRVPRDFYTYYLKGQSRLGQKYTFGDGTQLSFLDLVAQSDTRYLLDQTEYSIDGGTTYKKVIPLEWSRQKLPPVLMVVNDRLSKAFIYVQEAYNECTSRGITSVKVRYNSKVYTVPVLPNNKPNMVGYLLSASISTDGGAVNAPVINSNPTNPTAGTSVTFSTSSACSGTIKWYSGDAQMSSGLSYTVTNPVANDSYFATCTVGTTVSLSSNLISIAANSSPPSGTVTITEPAIAYTNGSPNYYFSDGHAPAWYDGNAHLPAIFTNSSGYDPVNDLVWMKNDKIKLALNLKRGGQIAWASLINDTSNLVYNGYDGGFQVQMDAYQKKDGYQQNGKYSRAQYSDAGQYTNSIEAPYANNLTSYNVTQGGDFLNHAVSLIEYKKVGTNGYYIKMRPNFYTINSEISQTFIEATYTIEGYSVKCDYKYTSYRTDGQYDGGGFDGGHAPVCFLVNNLRKFKSYTGNQPWTRASKYNDIEDGDLPNETPGQSTSGTPLTKNSKERWSLVYNPDNQKTIGVYANTTETENSFSLKQVNIYDGNGTRVGGEFNGGYSIIGRNYDLVGFGESFNRSEFSKTISSYLIVTPNPNTFIDTVYQISNH